MIYLSKTIHKIFLIDLFTPEERLRSDFKVTDNLNKFFVSKNEVCKVTKPDSEVELLDCLNEISNSELGSGIIIHLISHGDSNHVGFGNTQFYMTWEQLREPLVHINRNCHNGLIVNTTCMCYGQNIFTLLPSELPPFYAAIGSVTKNSLRSWLHNRTVYEKCLVKDYAEHWIMAVNNNLDDQRYVISYSGDKLVLTKV